MSRGSKFLESLTKGIPSKETEIMRKMMGLEANIDKVKSLDEMDLTNVLKTSEMKTSVLDDDVRKRLVSGEKAKDIVKEVGLDRISKSTGITRDEYLKEQYGIGVNDENPKEKTYSKDEVKNIVDEYLCEILNLSKDKLKSDKNYVKETLAEVVTFIKLKESLSK